jgi:hypothetical protein
MLEIWRKINLKIKNQLYTFQVEYIAYENDVSEIYVFDTDNIETNITKGWDYAWVNVAVKREPGEWRLWKGINDA